MIRFSYFATVLLVLAVLGCGAPPPPAAHAPDPGAPADHLAQLVERYWDENSALLPWYSWGGADLSPGEPSGENIAPQSLADSLTIEQRYLAEVLSIPRSTLDAESNLTWDIFRRERVMAIEGFVYPVELLPVNPYEGVPQRFASMASAAERLASASDKDYANWRARCDSFVQWTRQAIVNMRDGMRRGYTVPRVLVTKTLPQLAALGEDTPANVLYSPTQPGTEDPARARLNSAITADVKERIMPAYRALHDFLIHEYLPRARASVGLSALPLGAAWYTYLVKRTTGTVLTPVQLQTLGAGELDRLRQRMGPLLAEASFAGDAKSYYEHLRTDPRFSYTTTAAVLAAYQDLKVRVGGAAPALFSEFPRAEFGMRSVEAYRESVVPPLSYRRRAPNGLIGAVLYVNTGKLDAMPDMFVSPQYLREAVPGHHYQLELQRERADFPRFRRFGGAAAFIEGWALYAATLGDELGIYRDPESKFGALLAQMKCAADLVIDPGVHAQGWSRQQAIEYLHVQIPMDDAAAAEAVDRIIALPADGLACAVGYLKIQSLRTFAQQTLGTRFDPRSFHAEVVSDGAVPLDVLETHIKAWVATPEAAAPKDAPPPASAAVEAN